MSGYSVVHEAADTGVFINITHAATTRISLYDVIVGTDSAPADAAISALINRSTSVGTGGTALTEEKLDPLAPALVAAAVGGNFTTDPTNGNTILNIGFNQRATFRWVATPGRELRSTASANNGLCLDIESVSTGSPTICATLHWLE